MHVSINIPFHGSVVEFILTLIIAVFFVVGGFVWQGLIGAGQFFTALAFRDSSIIKEDHSNRWFYVIGLAVFGVAIYRAFY